MKAHIRRVYFLKMLFGVKRSTDTQYPLWEIVQMPLYSHRFHCVFSCVLNSLLSTKNTISR